MIRVVVEVEDPAWRRAVPKVAEIARRAARVAAQAEPGSLTVLLTDDAVVRDLNARFRNKDAATNVLSFPAAPNPEGHRGDIALAFGVCAAEAAAQGKTLPDHLSHLVIHGVLHLAGHDHEDDAEAEAMEAVERRLLARLGIADPYFVRELQPHG